MTDLTKKLAEKRARDAWEKNTYFLKGAHLIHREYHYEQGYKAGAEPRDILIAKMAEALEKEIFRQERDDGGAFNYLTQALAALEQWLGKEKK